MLSINGPKNVGENLKKRRTVKGITLQDVSNATGLSVSFLSLVENGKSGISMANLQKILKCYDTSINDLIDTSEEVKVVKSENVKGVKYGDARIVRSEEAKRIHSDTDDVKILSLVKGARSKKIWPGLFIMGPGTTIGPFNHEGEEFSYMIQGKIEVTLTNQETGDTEKYIITEGDTIYYPSTYLHTYVNLSKQKSIFLAAVTPPTF
ncbi:MAG: XRE family transcriptional regulator [Deltaproteobacteria bacterium]|nr:XRE family transcriptional regulator [Deltaproteobacteria bacterium]